jgi:hypothetical protein
MRSHCGTHKGHQCQEGVRTWPGDYAPPGWADCSSGSFLAAARVFPPCGLGSSWSARSRAAVRTNELDAGRRREILEGEEGLPAVLAMRGRVRVPGVAGGVVSQAPIRRRVSARRHDHVSGTGLLSQMIERGLAACSCRKSERARGLAAPPVFTTAAAACWHRRPASQKEGARHGSAACGRLRWWRSSCPGAWRWRRRRRRIRGTAWRPARPGS